MDKSQWEKLAARSVKLGPNDGRAALHLAFDFGLTALSIGLALKGNFIAWFVGEALLFACFWRWFGILHTCVHGVFFRGAALNRWTGRWASIFAFLPFESWRSSHLAHHRWTGWRARDPSLSLPSSEEISPSALGFLDFCWKFHIPIFNALFMMSKMKVASMAQASAKEDGRKDGKSGGGWFLVAGHLIFIFFMRWGYLRVFLLPAIFFSVFSDLVTLSQHNALGAGSPAGDPKPLALHEQDRYTRTLLYPRWMTRWLFLLFDKHGLHHLFPHVPHYRLEELGDCGMTEIHWVKWVREVKRLPGHRVYLE